MPARSDYATFVSAFTSAGFDRRSGSTQGYTEKRVSETPILLVDDQFDARLMMKDLLERKGFRVVAAATATEALDALAKESVTMVITDLYMPGGMSGLELLRQLPRHPKRPLRVIVVSGVEYVGGEPTEATARDLGAHAFLKKP